MKDMLFERIIAFIIGIILIGVYPHSFWVKRDTAWPIANGHVVASFVKKGFLNNETVIEYSYSVDNHVYYSTRLGRSWAHHYEFSYQRALNIIASYSPGKTVDVFYDPYDYQQSSLDLYFVGDSIKYIFQVMIPFAVLLLFIFAFGGGKGGMNRDSHGINFIAQDFRPKPRET